MIVAAATLTTLGPKLGLPALIERLYAATVILAAGGWIAAAAAVGPLGTPLP